MSYLDRLLKEAEAFVWDQGADSVDPVDPIETNSVIADAFDQLDWEFAQDTQSISGMVERLSADHESSPPAVEDMYHMLYKATPRFRDAAEMDPEYRINLNLLKKLFDSPEFQELRKDSVLDEYGAMFSLIILEPHIRAAFEAIEEQRERVREAAEQEQQAKERLTEAMDAAREAGQSGNGQDEAAQGLDAAMQAAQAAVAASQAADEAAEEAANGQAQGLSSAARGAQEALNEEKEQQRGYGLSDGQLQKMSFEERRALTKKLNQGKMAQFAKIIGQFREFANAERRRKVKLAPAEVYDYELGNDLTKLVSEELNNLAIPELEEQFWIRWAQHGLLQKKVEGPQHAGQGPILVVCDESGSMGAEVDGEGNSREAWSMAITLALADQARQGKRDMTYIGFSSPGQQWRIDFPGGVTPIEKITEMVEHMFNGGTSYERPLTQALDIVAEYAATGRQKPDVVFITDDDCSVSEQFISEWRKAKSEADIKCYGIQIGGTDRYGNMRKLADRSITLDRVNSNPEGMKELFRQI